MNFVDNFRSPRIGAGVAPGIIGRPRLEYSGISPAGSHQITFGDKTVNCPMFFDARGLRDVAQFFNALANQVEADKNG